MYSIRAALEAMDEELVDMERDGEEGNAECVSTYESVPVLVHWCVVHSDCVLFFTSISYLVTPYHTSFHWG